MEILTGVLTALVTVATTLGALFKFYLPHIEKSNSRNPRNNKEVLSILQDLKTTMEVHDKAIGLYQSELLRTLGRIEAKLG